MDLEKQEQKWQQEKQELEKKFAIRDDKKAFYDKHKQKSKISTTKLIMIFLLVNCTAIEIFTGYIVAKNLEYSFLTSYSPDFTPLTTLISTVVGEVISFLIYAYKSMKENTVGGITHDLAIYDKQIENLEYEER